MIGEKIQHYRITRLIGEGGMASVYEAVHEKLQSKVAIKILNPILTANKNIRERFENEARFMAGLNHMNITRVIDYEERPDLLAIVMEFLEGEDLNVKIKRDGPMSLDEVVPIFMQVLDAFEYAHKKSIVHRDVKPSNIFIEPSKAVKILDFGIAKLLGATDDMTATGTQIGTPVYMSPEQVNTDKNIDQRSDIYSLGVTLFYMLNGKPPYDTTTTSSFQIFTRIVYEPLPELTNYPEINQVLKIATHKDPAQRYQTCSAFKQALTEATQTRKTNDEPPKATFADDDKTLIDIPEPVRKEPKPADTKEKPVNLPPLKKEPVPIPVSKEEPATGTGTPGIVKTVWGKYKTWIYSGLILIVFMLSIAMKVFPGWYSFVFNTESRRLARQAEVNHLLDWVKTEYKKTPDARNYDSCVFYLQKAVDLDEENQDVLFYLSDALYHTMTQDGIDLTRLTYSGIAQASDVIEKVLKINPEYKNDSLIIDPYSRLTVFWGELALHYMANGKSDSALIAYKEGRKRGGFNDVMLEFARNTMNSCDLNSILLLSFDITAHPVLYLQQFENLRTDIKPLMTGFLPTDWYFSYITKTLGVPLSIGTIQYSGMSEITWQAQEVSIENVNTAQKFTWAVYPNKEDKLTKTAQLLLDIFKTNKFSKPFCFSIAFDYSNFLSLNNFLYPEGWVYKVKPEVFSGRSIAHKNVLENMSYEAINKQSIPSFEIRAMLDFVRSDYLRLINELYDRGDQVNAKELLNFLAVNISHLNYPFYYKEVDAQYQATLNKVLYTEEQRIENEKKNIREYLTENNLTGTPTASGLYYIEKVAGQGAMASAGKKVKVHYTFSLLDGTRVDSSDDQGKPLEFILGVDRMIPGFEEGISMMKQGSKALIIIPYNLGYGNSDRGKMPAYSTIAAEIELLEVN
ncbi:MAG: protein kinase [Bacteroidales bacterium]|nr:protein kinase [Bacteroidales bacterium]